MQISISQCHFLHLLIKISNKTSVQLSRPPTFSPAGSSHIGNVVRLQEEERLQLLHVVHAVADAPGEADGPDLLELGGGEGSSVLASLVPEPVSKLQVMEGSAHHTGKCRPNQ